MLERDHELLDDLEVGELAVDYDDREPEDVLEWALNRFGEERFAIITALQADGMVLIDMAHRINARTRVITIDTGRMPQEQYDIIEEVRKRYGIRVEVMFPDPASVESMVTRHGPNLFFQTVEKRLLCCHVRKVLPLNRALKGLDCWATGLRRDQWATRANIKKIELDHDHGGIVKISPLADWTEQEVWKYIKDENVPTHPLYELGYKSLGCAPCTRPVPEGMDGRSGRWWWETNAPKECGMHCSIETGGFEHEVEAILGRENGHALAAKH
jgi:thioredoxin-dependent adenylylsulfate APS reductase